MIDESTDMSEIGSPNSDEMSPWDIPEPRTFTVARAVAVKNENGIKRPWIYLEEGSPNRPWKPGAIISRILQKAWGKDGSKWVGRRVTLFNDETVTFGKELTGGIRIAALSGITTGSIRVKGGRQGMVTWTGEVLPDAPAPTPDLTPRIEQAVTAFSGIGVTVEQITAKLGGRATDAWTAADLDELGRIYQAIQSGEVTAADEFGGDAA